MHSKQLNSFLWGCSIILGVILSLPVEAQEFPITQLRLRGYPSMMGVQQPIASLTVPDTDTSLPAYGDSRLRRYDIHLAKMFEVTIWWCSDSWTNKSVLLWHYWADNGAIDMGNFWISCSLASEISKTYGLGRMEQTTLDFPWGGETMITAPIPTLRIEGNKINQWLEFSRRFDPIKR